MTFGGSEPGSECGRPSMTIQEIAEIKATFRRTMIEPL